MKSIHDCKLEAIGNGPDHIREVSGSGKYKLCTVWNSWFRDSSNHAAVVGWEQKKWDTLRIPVALETMNY